MPSIRAAVLGLALALAPVAMPAAARAEPLTSAQLATMATNMGYTPKWISTDPALPKLEIVTTAGTFNIPVGLEVSSSGRFIWVTANLGVKTLDAERANSVLKRAVSVQPTQFW